MSERYAEILFTSAKEETYKAAYRYESALMTWAYYLTREGKNQDFPKMPQALADLLKREPDELKREAIKHQLDWQAWAKKMGVIKP